jgi:Copper type II ascorbate-dependent monooxygenase, C-terminal domain
MNDEFKLEARWQVLAIAAVLAAACGSPAASSPQGDTAAGSKSSSPFAGTNAPPAFAGGGSVISSAGQGSTIASAGVTGSAGKPSVAGSAGAGGSATPAPVAGTLPCAVSNALVMNCQKCHGSTTAFGAPMSLVTYADLQKPAVSNASKKVYEMAVTRLADKANPMPPGGMISDADRATLTTWFSAGAPAAAGSESTCDTSTVRAPHDEAYFKAGLTPLPGETCFDLQVHGGQTDGDKTVYSVATGEHYEQFYFKVPWGADDVMTRYGGKFDNLKVVHHWLLFTSNKAATQVGTHETTIGTTLGDSSQLIAGWAVGGDNVVFPPDTALELSTTGILNAQWHFNNTTGAETTDSSTIQVCTMKRTARKNIASLTFLGTENFNGPIGMPAKTMSKFSGSCTNDSNAPITIIGFNPHMHKLGRHMFTTIMRASGTMETVFDKDFDFNNQVTYILDTPLVLQPNDVINSTCTFDNETNAAVPFGPSTTQEMCYNFTMSYPAKALDNGVISLIGATNTCW